MEGKKETGSPKVLGISSREFLCIIVIFAFFIRAVAAASFFEYLDLGTWNIPWAQGMAENPFTAYARIENLDYPPIFPTMLSIIGKILGTEVVSTNESLIMFFIKLIPICFDIGTIILFYFIGKKYSEKVGLLAAGFWALNPSLIFNISYWGQSDSILIFLLVLTFYMLENDRPELAAVFYAISCLTKLQAVYFAFLFVFRLFQKYPLKRSVISLAIGIAVGIVGWLPYMIGAGNFLLPFEIYLGGFGSYPYVNLNAYNIYGIGNNNFVTWDKSFIGGTGFDEAKQVTTGGLTYHSIGTFFLIFIFLSLAFAYFYSSKEKKSLSSYPVGMCFANLIFMLTVSQHERYQIPVLAFAMLCWLYYQTKPYFIIVSSMTVITFFAQATLIFKYQGMKLGYNSFYIDIFRPLQVFFSICNVILMFYMLYTVAKTLNLFGSKSEKDIQNTESV